MATIRILLTTASVALFAGMTSAASAQACDSRSGPDCRPAQQTRSVQKVPKAQSKARQPGAVSRAVMGGESSVALIARLPWWRADQPHLLSARLNSEVESQVLVAADAWLVAFAETSVAAGKGDRIELASTDGLNDIASDLPLAREQASIVDAGELNEIDLAAAEAPSAPGQSWLHVLLAMLGGAFAAASTARFVMV